MKKAAAVAAGVLAIAVSVTPVLAQGKTFPDVPQDHWAAQAVQLLADRGIVIGYPDGSYSGPRAMTRYEFAMAISRLIPLITQEINNAVANIKQTPVDLSGYAKLSDIPSTTGFATTDQLNAATQKLQDEIDALKNPAAPPPVDLSNYYTKPEVDQKFGDYYNKGDVDNKINDLNNKIGTIQAMLDRYGDELKSMHVDVDKLKTQYSALEARVANLEKLRVYGTGTAIWKSSAQYTGTGRGQYSAGVDADGALLDQGTQGLVGPGGNATGKHGIFSDPSALFDSQIGIAYSPNQKLSMRAEFIMGNYYSAWNEQNAFSAGFNGNTVSNGLLSNRSGSSLALQTYLAYLSYPVNVPFSTRPAGSELQFGRIQTQLTPLTWRAVDPDTYINIPREDSGNILVTGAKMTGDIGGVGYTVFGGYQPTDGTDPWTIQSQLDPGRNGTVGFGHTVRPGGAYGIPQLNYANASRSHLSTTWYQIPTLQDVYGAHVSLLPWLGASVVGGTGDDWRNNGPAFQAPTATGAPSPLYNRYGLAYSANWNATIPLSRLISFLPNLGFQGETAWSKTNNWGAYGIPQNLPSQGGNATDYKWTVPLGSSRLYLGGQSISAGFNAPGYWGQMGSWVNPFNYTTDSPIYAKSGHGANKYEVPIVPTSIGFGLPINGIPYLGDLAFSVQDEVGHIQGNAAIATPVSPTTAWIGVNDPSYFRVTHASAGLSFDPMNSGYKIGLSAEDVLRDYPAGGGFSRDVTFLWDALKNLVNIRGGTGAHQITPKSGPLGLGIGEAPIQSDENYYNISIGKNLTADGSTTAKVTFQRIVYNDRFGTAGGSYRGAVGTMQVSYHF